MGPALRLIKISFVAIFVFGAILVGLRFLGLQQNFSSFSHPLLNFEKIFIWPPESLEELRSSQFIEAHNLPLISCQFLNGSWRVHLKNKSVDLKQVLNNSLKQNFVLKILSLEHKALSQLVRLLKSTSAIDRVIVTSSLAQINRELRKLAPQLIFLGHFKEISQLSVMSILFIEPLTSLQSDIYAFPFDKVKIFSKEILEIQRRHKKIILLFKSKKLFLEKRDPYDGAILEFAP